jgi:hypothetical protein
VIVYMEIVLCGILSLGWVYILAVLLAASASTTPNKSMDNIAEHVKLYDPNNIALGRSRLMIPSLPKYRSGLSNFPA